MIKIDRDKYETENLLELMQFLRSDQGCPWDRAQTHQSIKKNALEEAYEVVDAIDSENPAKLEDELGDLLLQVVFHSQMAEEKKEFDFSSVVDHLCRKLISRHTHLFGKEKDEAGSPEEVLNLWNENKKKEKSHKAQTDAMIEIPRVLPALQRAYKIQKMARQCGFDWDDRVDVVAKIKEEILEVEEAAQKLEDNVNSGKHFASRKDSMQEDMLTQKKERELDIGDLLVAVVNYARFLDVEPEIALDKANQKFIGRFGIVEQNVHATGRKMEHMTLAELDLFWNEAKKEK